jgi:hypothetical protein
MSDDGMRALVLKDVAKADWEKKKIWIPAPPYSTGLYNTLFCNLRDSEKDLFMVRVTRQDPSQIELF